MSKAGNPKRPPHSNWTKKLDELYVDAALRGFSVYMAWKDDDIRKPFEDAGISKYSFFSHQYKGSKTLQRDYLFAKYRAALRESMDAMKGLMKDSRNERVKLEAAEKLYRYGQSFVGQHGSKQEKEFFGQDTEKADLTIEVVRPDKIDFSNTRRKAVLKDKDTE